MEEVEVERRRGIVRKVRKERVIVTVLYDSIGVSTRGKGTKMDCDDFSEVDRYLDVGGAGIWRRERSEEISGARGKSRGGCAKKARR